MKGSGKLTCVSGAIGALKETLKELSESAMSSMHFRQGNLRVKRPTRRVLPSIVANQTTLQIAPPCPDRNLGLVAWSWKPAQTDGLLRRSETAVDMNTSTSTSTFTTVISDLPKKTWDQKVDERAFRAMSRHKCSKSSRGLSSTESVQQPPWNRVPASMSPRGIDCRREHAKANAKVERLFRPAVENNLIDYYQEPTSSARPAPPPATSTHRPLRKNIADVRKQLNLLADEVRSGEVPLSMEEIAEALSVLDKDLVLCERQALNVASERPKSPTSKPKEPKEVPKAKEIDGLDERGRESFERAFTRQPATPVVQVKLSGFQRTGFERERGAAHGKR